MIVPESTARLRTFYAPTSADNRGADDTIQGREQHTARSHFLQVDTTHEHLHLRARRPTSECNFGDPVRSPPEVSDRLQVNR